MIQYPWSNLAKIMFNTCHMHVKPQAGLTPVWHDTFVSALLLKLSDVRIEIPTVPWQEEAGVMDLVGEIHMDIGHIVVETRIRHHIGKVRTWVGRLELLAVRPLGQAL